MIDYSKLATPAEDGDVLIEPPVARWPELIEGNRRILDTAAYASGGFSLRAAREQFRSMTAGGSVARPVVASGHQPEFVHPGVWAKHVVLSHVAGQLDHGAIDLVVDHHAPRSDALTVPFVDGDGWVATRKVALTHGAPGSSYEGRPVMEEGRWRETHDEILGLVGTWADATCVATYLDGLRRAASPGDFVDQHLAGRAALDRRFEATLTELRVSEVYGAAFAADLLVNAAAFAGHYNAALGEYRQAYRVKSPNRPLPDLGREGDRQETAFWIYRPGAPRRRLWVTVQGDRMVFYGDADKAGEVGIKQLRENASETLASLGPWQVRPRALTLTLWARLLACDLFVHGIGGAKYDRITDRIIERFYGIEPPAYACVSATLRLPLPVQEGSEAKLRTARRELRDVHYNPQRYLDAPPEDLLARRRDLIAESDRLRREKGGGLRRREVFRAIREVNERLLRSEAGLEDRVAERVERLKRARVSDELALSREYFYAFQPAERLEELAGRLRSCS